jgi:hypothetical protein
LGRTTPSTGIAVLPAILPHVLFLLFPLLVALGAVSDALTMTIPDRGGATLLGSLRGEDVTPFCPDP